MRQVPKFCANASHPNEWIVYGVQSMAIYPMGALHRRPITSSTSLEKFILVNTDHFSKWIEAKSYAAIKDTDPV